MAAGRARERMYHHTGSAKSSNSIHGDAKS
jgi:hypothetical protein